MRRWTKAVFVFVAFTLVACGGGKKSGQQKNPATVGPGTPQIFSLTGNEFTAIDPGTLVAGRDRLSVKAAILFLKPIPKDDNNYAVDFSLTPGGSVELLANSDKELKDSVRLKFTRDADNKLKVELRRLNEYFDLSKSFETVEASQPISLEFDIHEHGHLIAWVGGSKKGEFSFTSRPTGKYWGLTLDGAVVTQAKVGPAKSPD